MIRRFIFKNTVSGRELILPVSPSSFSIENGIRVEKVNILGVGDVNLMGNSLSAVYKIDCLFPSRNYPFNHPSTNLNPYTYVEFFQRVSQRHEVCNFYISNTPIRTDVIIESISYGEKDGTNDVYATLTLAKYKSLKAPFLGTATNNAVVSRTANSPPPPVSTYKVKRGDTLSSICRKFYGDSYLYVKLASFNAIKNPNIITVGQAITLPKTL